MMIYRQFILLVFSLMCTLTVHAQNPAEQFGALPETWATAISPSGDNLALGCSPMGVKAVCVYSLTSDAKPKLIAPPDDAEITSVFWVNDKYLIYRIKMFENLSTSSGMRQLEILRMVSYDIQTGDSQILMRNIPAYYGGDRVDSFLVNDDRRFLTSMTFIGDWGRLKNLVYSVDMKTGRAKLKDEKQKSIASTLFDASGEEIAIVERDYQSKLVRLVRKKDGNKTLFETRAEQSPLSIAGLGQGGNSLIVYFDDETRYGLYEMRLANGAISPVMRNGEHVGNPGVIEDPFTHEIVGYRYTNDLNIHVFTEPIFDSVATKAKAALKADSILLTSWTQEKSAFTVAAVNAGRPTTYYLFETNPDAISPLGGEAPWLDNAPLGTIERFDYTARDGMALNGYVTYPSGRNKTAQGLPLVVLPHGGPEARDDASYDWLAQAIADQGYLVIQPNFRGSSGFGQEYRNAGYGEFGGKMVDDVIDAANWAVSEGIAAPDYCVVGWSYGGYSALMTALKDPNRVKCTASINGVTDPGILFTDTYRGGPGFAYWEDYVGDFFKRTKEQRLAFNPYDRAAEFKTPILLIHGDEDLIVPVSQSRKLSEKLGSKVRYIEFDGQDHQLNNTATRKRLLTELLAFIEQNHPAK